MTALDLHTAQPAPAGSDRIISCRQVKHGPTGINIRCIAGAGAAMAPAIHNLYSEVRKLAPDAAMLDIGTDHLVSNRGLLVVAMHQGEAVGGLHATIDADALSFRTAFVSDAHRGIRLGSAMVALAVDTANFVDPGTSEYRALIRISEKHGRAEAAIRSLSRVGLVLDPQDAEIALPEAMWLPETAQHLSLDLFGRPILRYRSMTGGWVCLSLARGFLRKWASGQAWPETTLH